jgi:MFS family permease
MAVQLDTVSVTPARPLTAYKVAWCIALVFYFLEYVGRSAPAVMIPELTAAFDVSVVKLSAIIGSYYYTYAVASLLAGASLDRYGASVPIAIGASVLGVGCLLFAIPVPSIAESGRLLQGLGSAFAFTGAVFLASRGFSGRSLATAVGCTQCVGMLGGSAGQIAVGPLVHGLTDWRGFWIATAFACLLTAAAIWVVTPLQSSDHHCGPGSPWLGHWLPFAWLARRSVGTTEASPLCWSGTNAARDTLGRFLEFAGC